jgi:hypothetical protein
VESRSGESRSGESRSGESRSGDRERRLLALLCVLLPELRTRAERGLWTDELDEMVADLRAGGSPAEVAGRLGLTGDDDPHPEVVRGVEEPGIEGARLAGLDEVHLSGDYRCPATTPCTRRGHRDDRGHVPVCTVTGKPMVHRS